MGQKQKTEREKEERLNDGDNNGQATDGARMATASRLGQNFFLRNKTDFYPRLLLLTYFGESSLCEDLFPPIFWHN